MTHLRIGRLLATATLLLTAPIGSAAAFAPQPASPPALQSAAVAVAKPDQGHDQACRRQFDRAVRAYVRTTQQRDAAGFNALLHPDVTVVFANGGVISGRAEVAAFIRDFFADPGWSQTFAELDRHVVGCQTGFVLFDSVYSVPAEDRVSPLVIGVTFTYRHGRWLVLHNQDSNGPASR